MVAALVSDLYGAKAVGMKAIYINRWTDDIDEEQEQIRKVVDVYQDGVTRLPEALESLSAQSSSSTRHRFHGILKHRIRYVPMLDIPRAGPNANSHACSILAVADKH